MCTNAKGFWPRSALVVLLVAAPLVFFVGCTGGGGADIPPTLVGEWVTTRGYAPHTDVLSLRADGTAEFYGDYACTELNPSPQFEGWSLSGSTLTTTGGTDPGTVTISWLNDNAVQIDQEGTTVATIYRKGHEPDGAILAAAPTALIYAEWMNSTIRLGESHLYSFTATGSEWLYRWPYDAPGVVLTVYGPDKNEIVLPTTDVSDNPMGELVSAGSTYYVVVECSSAAGQGDYQVGWDVVM